MQSFKKIAGVIAIGMPILLLSLPAARAATLDISGGELIGAQNIDVGGVMYDVSFEDGRCVDLFGGCDELSDFTFQDQTSAASAALALIDQVFGNDDIWDTNPENTRGCGNSNVCQILTVYGLIPANSKVLDAVASNKKTTRTDDTTAPSDYGILDDTTLDITNVYAVWSSPASAVPIPAAIWLFGAALAGLAGFSKRRKAA